MTIVDSDLHGRHIVVTGGFGQLGRAVVEELMRAGAVCHVPARGEVPAELSGLAGLHGTAGVDLTCEAEVEVFYRGLPELWASVHLAGGFAMAAVTDTTLAQFEGMYRLNAVTSFLCCREAARHLRGRGGRIVNVAARPALEPTGGLIAYAAAKAAVAAITRALAAELVNESILVNAIVPSVIDTASNRAAMPGADHERWPKPAELAAAIRFLVSPTNTTTSGVLLPCYGRA
jgi:NAD(P)-dependent dehydrogenase (short-subunit alcohol dehydrogenase family)